MNVINEKSKFNELYDYSEVYQIKRKESLIKMKSEIDNKVNDKKICKKSEKIYDQLKIEIFNYIFDILKHPKKQIIIGVEADLNLLPEYIHSFISTLITELGNLNETFDRSDFLLACEEIYKVIIL